MTARVTDSNGWYEIAGNPLSKVGVYPYLGSSIDPNGTMDLDPDGVYNVYRSERELSNPETIDSFKLLPWIEDHDMLGAGGGQLISPESKGVDGVIGEDVYFADGFLRGNVKLFSESLADTIASGKKELSCGYRCKYAPEKGVFGDMRYDFIQTDIRGNHVASVDAGRMGPEVAVLDQQMVFTVDHEDFKPMGKVKTPKTLEAFAQDGVKPGQFAETLQLLAGAVVGLQTAMDAKDMGEHSEDEEEKAEDEDQPNRTASSNMSEDTEEEKGEDMEGEHTEDEEEEKGEDAVAAADALDILGREVAQLKAKQRGGVKAVMREINSRDKLAAKATEHLGTFVYDHMTTDEVAVYACDKLGLKPQKGHEVSALDGYFANRRPVGALSPGRHALGGRVTPEVTDATASYFN